jgi:hypothetical protein
VPVKPNAVTWTAVGDARRPWEVPGELFWRLDMQPFGCLN